MAERGIFADHAASLVMKLMYGVPMSGPRLSTVVARLSSQITKWTRDSDRRLHRIYSYLAQAKNLTLKGSLSTHRQQSGAHRVARRRSRRRLHVHQEHEWLLPGG